MLATRRGVAMIAALEELVESWSLDVACRRCAHELRNVLHRHAIRASRLVVLESPYAGNVERNLAYARAAMRDSLLKLEYPIASHLLYAQAGILDDMLADERALGIEAGLAWGGLASRTVVYADLGISAGMQHGIDRARVEGREVVVRKIDGWQP